MRKKTEIDFNLIFSGKRIPKNVDDVDFEPLPENSYGAHGNVRLVGHGEKTANYCGKFHSFYACSRVELHNRVILDGRNFKGKVYFKSVFKSCGKPSCPVCYRYGWAVREARSIKDRLALASKHFGLVEHIVVSVPPKDYNLSYKALRRKVDKVLKKRGIVGGVKIFHAFRYN